MWELFNKISSKGITPNQFYILLALKEKVSPKEITDIDTHYLMHGGYIKSYTDTNTGDQYASLTDKGKSVLKSVLMYYKKVQTKTDTDLMGADYKQNIEKYRETFPAKKLPSGKPARSNVKTLAENFRWFFNNYNYAWDEVLKATQLYVDEYRNNDYMYMKTSQYFISKQDKHKIKHSELADYCDMIRDGFINDDDHFSDNVV